MKFLRITYIILPVIIALSITGNYIFASNEIGGIILYLLSVILMIITFIDALIAKKWLKLILYFLSYTTILIFSAVIVLSALLISSFGSEVNAAFNEFYNQKLTTHLNLSNQLNLKVNCTNDNVSDFIMNGHKSTNDQSSCVFILENDNYNYLVKTVDSDFKKIEYENNLELDTTECYKSIEFLKTGYASKDNAALVVFSVDSNFCYFKFTNNQ